MDHGRGFRSKKNNKYLFSKIKNVSTECIKKINNNIYTLYTKRVNKMQGEIEKKKKKEERRKKKERKKKEEYKKERKFFKNIHLL